MVGAPSGKLSRVPICEGLGLPVPAEPFPVMNTTDDFRAVFGVPPVVD